MNKFNYVLHNIIIPLQIIGFIVLCVDYLQLSSILFFGLASYVAIF